MRQGAINVHTKRCEDCAAGRATHHLALGLVERYNLSGEETTRRWCAACAPAHGAVEDWNRMGKACCPECRAEGGVEQPEGPRRRGAAAVYFTVWAAQGGLAAVSSLSVSL